MQMELKKMQTNKLFNIEQEEVEMDDNERQLIEKQKVIDVLKKQLEEYITLNSSYQIKIDSMRLEISRLKTLIENHSSTNSGTPTSVRNNQFHIFKTPIRTISRTLLSPFRSANTKNTDRVESESEDDNNTFENSNDSSTVVEIHTTYKIENKEVNKLSFDSTHELMNSDNNKTKLETVMDFMFSCMSCKTCKQTKTISMNTKQFLTKDNKIYPTVEDNYKVNRDIPLIFITTPTV